MLDSIVKFNIPLSTPCICGNEWKYIKDCLDSGWVSSSGKYVDIFEKNIAEYTGVKFAVSTVNGTSALHIALLTVGVKPLDEVIVSALTFISPVNAIKYCGAFPVFMDANPSTWQMDTNKLESFLENETEIRGDGYCYNRKTGRIIRAILPVHILGGAVEIEKVVLLSKKYNLKVIEDSAEGLGVRYKGKHIGCFGDIGILSFNGNKIITTGGGGMIITDNKEYAEYAHYLVTQAKDDPIEYIHNEIGYNYRLTNLHSAMGVAQLEKLEGFIEKKKWIFENYYKHLKCIEGISFMEIPNYITSNYWIFAILVDGEKFGEGSRNLAKRLNDEGVQTRPLWHPVNKLKMYINEQGYLIEECEKLYKKSIQLPSSVSLTDKELEFVVGVIKETLKIFKGD